MPTSTSQLPPDVRDAQATMVSPAPKLALLLLAIRSDSQDEPSLYLDETVVPFGGE